MSDVQCKARNAYPDPQDCDWPHCGCDERASKVVEALIEEGWSPPSRAPSPPELERERLVEIIREAATYIEDDAILSCDGPVRDNLVERLRVTADAILAALPRMGVETPAQAALDAGLAMCGSPGPLYTAGYAAGVKRVQETMRAVLAHGSGNNG